MVGAIEEEAFEELKELEELEVLEELEELEEPEELEDITDCTNVKLEICGKYIILYICIIWMGYG